MGIGYRDSVVVYNQCTEGVLEKETWYGTRFDGVRVELTKGNVATKTGNKDADSCRCKIPSDVAKDYVTPAQWENLEDKTQKFTFRPDEKDFFIIVKKPELGIDIQLPTGKIEDENFMLSMEKQYGYTFKITTVDVFSLIPRYELGGK